MRDAFEAFLAAAAAAGLVLKEPPSTTAAATAPAWCVQQQSSSSVEFVSGGATTFNGGAGHGMMPSAAGFSRSSTTTTTTTVTSSGASSVTTVTSSSSSSFFAASASSSSKEQQQAARRMELEALAPLVAMAQAECRHENLEAAQALARLSASEDNRTLLAQNGQAIPALVALVGRTVCPEVQRAVVAALSNLSESASCKSPLVAAGAVTRLVRLVCGEEAGPAGAGAAAAVPYRLLETRRESARTLANLSEEHAAAIIREAGREQVVDLMRRVDELRDERLRMHARRLKARVGVCC